jgi:hypothetical protein
MNRAGPQSSKTNTAGNFSKSRPQQKRPAKISKGYAEMSA